MAACTINDLGDGCKWAPSTTALMDAQREGRETKTRAASYMNTFAFRLQNAGLPVPILNDSTVSFRPDVCTLLHTHIFMPKMQPNAEAKVVHLDAECGGKKRKKRKQRKSKRQLEKIASASRERMSKFLQKKDEERALKGSLARQQALEQLGITQEFNHSDHAEIYSYADHAVAAPIETVDASIAPPELTIEELYASTVPPPETMEPSNLALPVSARPAVRISSVTMRAKRMMLAHCAK